MAVRATGPEGTVLAQDRLRLINGSVLESLDQPGFSMEWRKHGKKEKRAN